MSQHVRVGGGTEGKKEGESQADSLLRMKPNTGLPLTTFRS